MALKLPKAKGMKRAAKKSPPKSKPKESPRQSKGERHFNGMVRCLPERLTDALHWKKPKMIFVNSMSDLFHDHVPFQFIDRVFGVMSLCPQHTFQILTKRPERTAEYLNFDGEEQEGLLSRIGVAAGNMLDGPWIHGAGKAFRPRIEKLIELCCGQEEIDDGDDGATYCDGPELVLPNSNVWLGTSIEDQTTADERIPHLLRCPAVVRFLSIEPLLGPVDLSRHVPGRCTYCAGGMNGLAADSCPYCHGLKRLIPFHKNGQQYGIIDWVIVGGESGPGARPMHPDWVRSIRDQCLTAGVPFFFKQWGEWAPAYELDAHPQIQADTLVGRYKEHEWPTSVGGERHMFRVGKKAAGAMLDGREQREWPGHFADCPNAAQHRKPNL